MCARGDRMLTELLRTIAEPGEQWGGYFTQQADRDHANRLQAKHERKVGAQ